SRITPRVTCTTNEVVCKCFSSGGFSIRNWLTRWLSVDPTIQKIQDKRLLRNISRCFDRWREEAQNKVELAQKEIRNKSQRKSSAGVKRADRSGVRAGSQDRTGLRGKS